MFRHILFKLLRWIPSVLVILFVVYALLFYGAGDPVRLMFLRAPGDVAWNPERIEAMRHELGLDRSFLEQFTEYIGNVTRQPGQLAIYQRSVSEMIKVAARFLFKWRWRQWSLRLYWDPFRRTRSGIQELLGR
jgi:ABC-type dipeptide/oligopeptide/nickel transport system permease component